MKHASGNFVVIMDADLSHHVSSLPGMWMIIDCCSKEGEVENEKGKESTRIEFEMKGKKTNEL